VSEGELKYATQSGITKTISIKDIKLKNRDTKIDNLFPEKIDKIWKNFSN
jgi:hypothetical protein